MIQPQVLLLKEGTDTSQGRGQILSNINACISVANILRSTLGPMGMDKLIKNGETATITNDGATIIRLLELVHPAAITLAEIAQSQDEEAGDGTTSVVLLAGELLKNGKNFIEEGVSPQSLASGFRAACKKAVEILPKIAFSFDSIDIDSLGVDGKEAESFKESPKKFLLQQCAKTSLNSKLIENEKDFFAKMLVDAFMRFGTEGKDFIDIKTVSGGSVDKSFLFDGLAFKKTFSYAGFEQQPKAIESPRIALLNVELELKSEHTDAEVRVNPGDFQAVVDAEWKILQDKLDLIADSGANVVLSCLPIGDLATQYFAEKKIFCAGRVPDKELKNMAKLSGGAIQTSLRGLKDKNAVGVCDHFEERQVGNERMNFFRKVIGKNSRGKHFSTIILRGGAEQYIEESSRSLNDAIMVLKNVVAQSKVVAGAGAAEMELSRALKQHARSLHSADSFFVAAFARALEAIPSALAANAGLDSTDILNELRFKHHSKNFCGRYFGVDIEREGTGDARKAFVWEPLEAKLNMVQAATEAACLILTVDDTVKAPKEEHAAQRMAQ